MSNYEAISTPHCMVETLTDASHCYAMAEEITGRPVLKPLFNRCSAPRWTMIDRIRTEVASLGGKVEDDVSTRSGDAQVAVQALSGQGRIV
jgi:hypothetical protein